MNTYKRIYINAKDNEIEIKEGETTLIPDSEYHVENDCLYIIPHDDVEIVVPVGKYEEIKVETTTADCLIDLPHSNIKEIVFLSNNGDLNINTNVEKVTFESHQGDFTNLGYPNKRPDAIYFSQNKEEEEDDELSSWERNDGDK